MSNNMKTTKDKRKKIQLNDKIKYHTRLQQKKLNQQELAKIKAEKHETKNIKTKVNKQLTININAKTPDSSESSINFIGPSTNKQSIKIPNERKQKNWNKSFMERKKNKKNRKSNDQPFLKINKKCFNISLDDIYYKNNFTLTHSFNINEFLDSFKFLSSPEVKVLDQTYDSYYDHTFFFCLDNYVFKPNDCIKKENDVHNLEQSIYINKNNSDNNHNLNIFKLLLLQYWCFYDFNTQRLFSKLNESKISETNYSEMLETDIISSAREIYSKFTTTKEASLLRQLLSSEIPGISVYEKACFLYDSFSFKTRKIYSLITTITKVQSTQNSNSKMIDMKKTSKIFTKLFKMKTLLPSHEIYFEITYMGKGLSLPKTYSEVTIKFRLSLPIIYFKNTKKKVSKKLDLSLNELLYSKLAKTKQDLPADKLYFKAENSSFSFSNLIQLIDEPRSQLETFFNLNVTERKYYLKTYSRKNLKKKLPLLKSYSKVIMHSKIFLLNTFSKKNIRDQKYILEIYSTLFEATIKEKCIKNASNINLCVITQSSQVIRIANEDNSEQLNHNQSSSDHSCILNAAIVTEHLIYWKVETPFHLAQIKNPDKQKACLENTTHLMGSDSCLCVDCYKAKKTRTSLMNLRKCACIVTTCEKTITHVFRSKWIKILKSLLLINKINLRVQTNEEEATHKIPICNEHYQQILLIAQCELCGNQGIQRFSFHKSKVHEYQSVINETEIPVTIKYDTIVCKSCTIYLELQGNKTTTLSLEFEKSCDATRVRIMNHYRSKMKKIDNSEINIKKTEEDDQLLLVKSLPTKKRNIFTPDSSVVLKPVSSAIEFANTTTTVITTTIETKPLMTTRTMTMATMSTVLTSATENPPLLGFNQKKQPTFNPSVPRTIKEPVTTNYRKHSLTVHKVTIPDHRITIPVEKPVSPIDKVDKSMTQIKKTKTLTSKPMIPVDRSTTLVNKSTISVDKPMVADHKQKLVFTPVLRSIFTSKFYVPNEHVKTPNSVSPIKIPTIVQTDQLLNNSLDSRSKSPLTECPKSSHQQTSKFSSTTPDVIQFYKNLKNTYPDGKAFVNNLMKLETCRNLGYFTVQNYETIHHQRKSCTATTPLHMMHYLSKP
ncbi:hypothetical protein AGLY_013974 [Aphis glycines]|uniref:Uncharacterized protein n=1 Tax=Aphis glycines TaxID=307491 RepID=A0A6G0T6U2_APHGL|nr:hypothetical protein AGLY_013974 [Aphis glycines]